MHVWVKPKLHAHKGCGLSFLPLLHTSYTVDCLTALVGEDVSSGCYVQSEGLHWVLLKDRNLALAPRQGPEISWACLWVSSRPRHHTQCWLTKQRLILLCVSCLETPRASSGPRNSRTEPPLASSVVISLPHTPACPGTQYSPTVCRLEISFNTLWHCWTNGDVLIAWRAFRAAWLSEHIRISLVYSEIEFHKHMPR